MQFSKRGYWALFFIALLAWDPASWAVTADPDTPNPDPNLEDVRSCSLIIAMDKSYQNGFNATGTLGTFNLQAYGLINHLLWNDIPVKWAIRSGKRFNETDFSALVEQIDAVNSTTLGQAITGEFVADFRASAFIIPITYITFALPLIQQYNTRTDFQFGQVVPVKVYRLKESLTNSRRVDIRYTLTKKPYVAVLNSSTYYYVLARYLDISGFKNGTHYTVMTKEQANSVDSSVCVSICVEPHFVGPFDTVRTPLSFAQAMHKFVDSGGNFLAECGGMWTYEQCYTQFKKTTKKGVTTVTSTIDCPAGFFLTDGGLDVQNTQSPNNPKPYYHNSDLAFLQFDDAWERQIYGLVDHFYLYTDPLYTTNLAPNAYWGMQWGTSVAGDYNNSYHSAGRKLVPGQLGRNVFYIAGHDVYYSNGGSSSPAPYYPGIREFMNAMFIPASRDASCGFDVDPCAWGGCGTYVKRSIEGVAAAIPCSCTEFCDNAGNCGTTPDPMCPIPAPPKAAAPPKSVSAPRVAPAPGAPVAANTPGSSTNGQPAAVGEPGTVAAPVSSIPGGIPVIDVNSTHSTGIVEGAANSFKYYGFVVSDNVADMQMFLEVLNWDETVTVDLYLKRGGVPTATDYDCVIPAVHSVTFSFVTEQKKVSNNQVSYCKTPLPALAGEWVAGVFSVKQTGFAFEGFLEPNYGRVTEQVIVIGAASALMPTLLAAALACLLALFM